MIYSLPAPVETIEEALQLIGLRQLRDLALGTCVISAFDNLSANLVNPPEFWKHSIACGITSSLIAQERHDPAPERFFVGGLLHDIGRLIMYMKAPEDSREILRRCETDHLSPCQIEKQVLGFDHAALGAEIMAVWGLPAALVEMVRNHHHPTRFHVAVGDAATVHYADFIVTALELGNSGESAVSPLSEDGCQRCFVEDDRIEPLVQAVEARCEPMCAILTKK